MISIHSQFRSYNAIFGVLGNRVYFPFFIQSKHTIMRINVNIISQYFNLIQNSYLIIFNLAMEKSPKNPFKNVHRIQQALAQAERIPVGGISNYPPQSQILKSRLLGLQSFSKDKRNSKTFQISKNQKSNWNKFLSGGQKIPSIYNQMQDQYKNKFVEYRKKLIDQPEIGGINKGGQIQYNQKKQVAPNFGMSGPFDRISNEVGKNPTGLFNTQKTVTLLPQTNSVFGANNSLSAGMEKPKVNIFSPSFFQQKPISSHPLSTQQVEEKEQEKKVQDKNSQGIKFPSLPNKPVDIFSKKLEVAESDRPVLVTTNKLFAEGNPWGQSSEAPKEKVKNIFFNSNIQNKSSDAQQKQKVKEIGGGQQSPSNQQKLNENKQDSKEKGPIIENNVFSIFSNKASNSAVKTNQQVSLVAKKKSENVTPQFSFKPLPAMAEKSNIFMNQNKQDKQEAKSLFGAKFAGNNQAEQKTPFTPFSNPQSETKNNQPSVFGAPSTPSIFNNNQSNIFGQKQFAKIPQNQEINAKNQQLLTPEQGFQANDQSVIMDDAQRQQVKQQDSGSKQQSLKEQSAPAQKEQNSFGNPTLTPFFGQNQQHQINVFAPKGQNNQSSVFHKKSVFDSGVIKQDAKQSSQEEFKPTSFLESSKNQVKSSFINQPAVNLTPNPFGSEQQSNFMNADQQGNKQPFMSLTPVDDGKEEKKDKIMFGMQSPSSLFGKKMQDSEKKPNASQILNSFGSRPLTPGGNIFSEISNNNSKGLFAPSNNGLFSQQNSSSVFGSTLQNTLFTNQNNTEKDDGEEEGDDDDNGSQLEREQQDIIDPSKSTGNYKYATSDVLFKDIAVKLRKGTADTVQNMTVSIQKIPDHSNKMLYIRMPNKQYYFYGTIMKGITQVNPLNSSRNISIKKIVFVTEQNKNGFEVLKIQFKDENIGKKFLQTLKDN